MREYHKSLEVRTEDFFPNYQRVWDELPEWDFDPIVGKPLESPLELRALPARTALHPSLGGRKFKKLTGRGDDFFDWDTNMFHFFGGTPAGESLAIYEGHAIDYYINEWESTPALAGRCS
jgi:hypothetical protein